MCFIPDALELCVGFVAEVLNTIRKPERDLGHFYANTYLIIGDCGHVAVASLRQSAYFTIVCGILRETVFQPRLLFFELICLLFKVVCMAIIVYLCMHCGPIFLLKHSAYKVAVPQNYATNQRGRCLQRF